MPGYVGDPISPCTTSNEFDFMPKNASSPAANGKNSLMISKWVILPIVPLIMHFDFTSNFNRQFLMSDYLPLLIFIF